MLRIYFGLLTVVLVPLVYCQTTYDLLDSLRFLNEGSISSSDIYDYQYESVGYTEPENVTRENHAWAETGVHPYLYQLDPNVPVKCDSNPFMIGIDLPGSDLLSIIPSTTDPSQCVPLCCQHMACIAWSYAAAASVDYLDCKRGQPCCYLKSIVPQTKADPTITSATTNRSMPYNHPPTGLRSAVPLGGITTGSIELRGDGTFHEWTVENQ